MEFADKFIGFVDVLGFKGMVRASEAGTGRALPDLLKLLEGLGSSQDRREFETYGPIVCPASAYVSRDLEYRATQISDCLIVSAEVSPAGIVNLVSRCWKAVFRLLEEGLMCRGYITRGKIFHTDTQVIGSGYQEAYEREGHVSAFKREADERGTPFVEVDSSVVTYVTSTGDECVKKMIGRMVASDGEVTALFPFQRLSHSFMIDRDFDAAKQKRSNDAVRSMITRFKDRVSESVRGGRPDVIRKAEHYLRALDAQLGVCDETDRIIDVLTSPLVYRSPR